MTAKKRWLKILLLFQAAAIAVMAVSCLMNTYCPVFFVTTDSMSPEIPAGSLILVKKREAVPAERLVGKPVVFYDPLKKIVVVHRVVRFVDGYYQTRGDNNVFVDSYRVGTSQILGEVVYHKDGFWEGGKFALVLGLLILILILLRRPLSAGSAMTAQRTKSAFRPRWKKVLTVLDMALIILLALEGFTRLVYPQPMANAFVRDERLGWRNKPSTLSRVKNAEYHIVRTANARGLRGREETFFSKPGEVKRVLLLGDSYTWGVGVSDEETYSGRLADMLGQGYQVLNAGVDAYGTDQEYLFLKEEGLRYQPDVVVLAMCLNDLESNLLSFRNNGPEAKPRFVLDGDDLRLIPAPAGSDPTPAGWAAAGLEFLNKRSHLYRCLKKTALVMNIRYARRIGKDLPGLGAWLGHNKLRAVKRAGFRNEGEALYAPYLKEWPPQLKESWAVTQRLILEMKRLTQARRARFVLLLVPYAAEIYPRDWQQAVKRYHLAGEDYDLSGPDRKIRRFCEENGITYLSLREAFWAADPQRLYFDRDLHWNQHGHERVAEVLGEYLKDWGHNT